MKFGSRLFIGILFLLYLLPAATFGQQINNGVPASLTGKVTDALTQEPLVKATIFIHDIKRGATTDNEGNYNIRNIPAGSYLVEVSFAGFGSSIENVLINGDVIKDVVLSPVIVENEGVTVTGVSGATLVKKTPVPVTLIKKETLFKGISTNLVDAISKAPGVSQVSTGPAISKPSIRGLGYNRVVVVNDGVRQEGQQWGDEHGIEIDEYNVNKIEILKGPASIMYGSDALAGVVNIISVLPVQQGNIKGNIFGNYQTNNRQRGLHADLGGNHDGFIWGFNTSFKWAADYRNAYDGAVFNSRFNERDMGAYIGLHKKWGFSHLMLSNFDQRPGIIEGDRDVFTGAFLQQKNRNGVAEEVVADNSESTRPAIPYQHVQHFKITSDNSFVAGRDRITLNAGFQQNQRSEFGNVLDPAAAGLQFKLRTINYNLQYHFAPRQSWKTTVGINGMQQSNSNEGEEQIIPDYHLFDIGGFVYSQKSFERVTLSGGFRVDNRVIHTHRLMDGTDLKFAALQKSYANLSASAGVSYQASPKTLLKLNIARGFRSPGIPEISSNGAHEGTNRYEYGEKNLQSEISYQFDGSLDYDGEHISLSTNIFYNAINHFIFYRKLNAANGGDSVIYDGNNQYLAFRFDQVNAALFGTEIVLDIHPHPLDWLHVENTFSFVRGRLMQEQDGSDNIPFIPAPRLINEVRAAIGGKSKVFKNGYIKIELDNTFAQQHPFTGYNTETATPAYHLLNAGIGFDIIKQQQTACSIYFAASNLTDVAYQSHLSRLKYTDVNAVTGRQGVFNMGRNFSFKLNVPLHFRS